MSKRRVVVTGLGAVTPLGVGVKRTWSRLLNAQSGIVSLDDPQHYKHDASKQKCRIAGLVPRGEWNDYHVNNFTQEEMQRTPNFIKYALVAAKEALQDANWFPKADPEQEMTGVCVGSAMGYFEERAQASLDFEAGGPKKVSPYFFPQLLANNAAGPIARKFGFKGPIHTPSTACTAGAHSIGNAAMTIKQRHADIILAGGADSCMHPHAFAGLEKMRALSTYFNHAPEEASRPFDKARDGFVIGEGAVVLVLEEMQHALAREAYIYAEVRGYGQTSDAYHITQPRPDGSGAAAAMRNALKEAQLSPADVDYINAHATSTRLGDEAEVRAIEALMLDSHGVGDSKQISVSSTKGATGHLLGAAGAAEAMFSVLTIKDGVIPPTLNLNNVDVPRACDIDFVPLQKHEKLVNVCLSNSYAFGGMNATLCFSRLNP